MAEISIHYSGPLVTKQEASRDGKLRYFHGRPCKHGHVSERYLGWGSCVECALRAKKNPEAGYRATKKWAAKNRKKRIEIDRRYKAANKELVKETSRAAYLRRYNKDPEAFKARRRKYRNIKTARDRQKAAGRPKPMFCEACGDYHPKIVFDHCHSSGNFRGWVCNPCNVALGFARDSPVKLRALADYLERMSNEAGRKREKRSTTEPVRSSGQEVSLE